MISSNSSAIFALLGATFGALITALVAKGQSERELKSNVWGIVLERRIEAHEEAIALAIELRVMQGLGYLAAEDMIDPNERLVRYPKILTSDEEFRGWLEGFLERFGRSSTWISINLKREMNLLQDYLLNVAQLLSTVDSTIYPSIGVILRDDFIGFSQSIEQLAIAFLSSDLLELKLDDMSQWHKYDRDETLKRLDATKLSIHRKDLERLISG